MNEGTINFDYEVKQASGLLAVLRNDPRCHDAACLYACEMTQEFAKLKVVCQSCPVDDDGDLLLDAEAIDAFLDLLDEVKAYIAGCIVFE